jgi:hypothetical protein
MLSTNSKKPSKILTDIDIYCDVEGKSTKNGKALYKLWITDQNLKLSIVKEKKITFKKGEDIRPKLKFNNFTFSNPYKSQHIRLEFDNKSKDFYFDGHHTH